MSHYSWFKDNQDRFSGELLFDEPLSKHCYYRIGGQADLIVVPKNLDDLGWIDEGLIQESVPTYVLGRGSNLLVSDLGYRGIVIKTTQLNSTLIKDTDMIRVGASTSVTALLRRASKEGWGGLEFLSGIPGSMGGVVFMNGGTHLGELSDRVDSVSAYLIGEGMVRYDKSELSFSYRSNHFLPQNAIVFELTLRVEFDNPVQVKEKIDSVLSRRKKSQPIDLPSCGSVFKNPKQDGLHSWEVIDRIGLRGHRIGDAEFSKKHCNFIVNLGQATADDVRSLIELAKSRAAEIGILLEEEVQYLGEFVVKKDSDKEQP